MALNTVHFKQYFIENIPGLDFDESCAAFFMVTIDKKHKEEIIQ